MVVEFLGLKRESSYYEKNLEIENLQKPTYMVLKTL